MSVDPVAATQSVVLITGCSAGGIGFALCEEFASWGCIVYATALELESMEGFQNPTIRKHILDVTNGDDIERTVQTILAETGKIDIVVNNAGALTTGLEYEAITTSFLGPVAEATIDQIPNTFELNTFGALRVSNAVIPSMFKRKKGLIVNMGSITGLVTTPWTTLYCAAKAALHSISEGLAMECKPFGVKVMLVAPGGVTSNLVKNQAATFTLSPTTMFKDYEPKIIERLNVTQGRGSMDTNEFARKVVVQALGASPPPYMTLGHRATLFYLLQWLPRQYVLERMYKALVG